MLGGRFPASEADRLALHNILQQLENLRHYPVVAARKELRLTRRYFDVGAGQVSLLDSVARSFVPAP